MSSTSETGHAKNVANFYSQISFITGYGAPYNPTKAALWLFRSDGATCFGQTVPL
ncbi:MAG: hypothetical protein JJE55_11135 [Flavobacteriaceae bacterium]|nr:hypothetical protein [Flavobacteriaceae bacterium]